MVGTKAATLLTISIANSVSSARAHTDLTADDAMLALLANIITLIGHGGTSKGARQNAVNTLEMLIDWSEK
jgi:hypothetical protein